MTRTMAPHGQDHGQDHGRGHRLPQPPRMARTMAMTRTMAPHGQDRGRHQHVRTRTLLSSHWFRNSATRSIEVAPMKLSAEPMSLSYTLTLRMNSAAVVRPSSSANRNFSPKYGLRVFFFTFWTTARTHI
eukprot:COSAG01_NODE_486_length_16379_cov_28.208717_18_plen_130_part_00